jgi:catalase
MRVDGNYGSTLHYEPNSYGEWQEQPEFAEPPLALDGAAAHWDYRADDTDYFTQPGMLYRLIGAEKQRVLCENTGRAMAGVSRDVQIRHIRNCLSADPAYGEGVAAALGVPMSEVKA